MEEEFEHVVYSKNVLEFVTVGKEYCQLIQQLHDISKKEFVGILVKILPLLYLKANTLPKVENHINDPLEKAVFEDEYEMLHQALLSKFGRHDDYLEVFTPDIQRSEGALAASISEDLTDIYQDLADFLYSFKMGITEVMNEALFEVITNFQLYWGQKLVNTLRACHNIYYGEDNIEDEEDQEETNDPNDEKNNEFFNRFQQQWSDDDDV
ncbi:DUF5063 domain-containing protein [bacterium]|nr:DUF5063 domain-containing protein [bacterium]